MTAVRVGAPRRRIPAATAHGPRRSVHEAPYGGAGRPRDSVRLP
jgi:hypothetical protein